MPLQAKKAGATFTNRETSEHGQIAKALGSEVYFSAPGSPWQRGSNENTNRLIRQYLPKKTDHSLLTQAELDRIAERINTRPINESNGFVNSDRSWRKLGREFAGWQALVLVQQGRGGVSLNRVAKSLSDYL
ncbi:IS30 family transposase [Leucobacter viscericola]|uniref:IS30 family transposase n=1 Tax=Leucobacter viscericola TaxID=2714935 RepID=A0A6G7XJW5_9MICO|nr:IS30 family transposase [Leucobacter viscericola]